jgi:hypothetical protein
LQEAYARDIDMIFDRANPLLVMVKATPQTADQRDKGHAYMHELSYSDHAITCPGVKGDRSNQYRFRRVFHGEDAKNADIFEDDIKRLIQSATTGRSFTLIAYGATGAGKSYTFLHNDSNDPSLMDRAIAMVYAAGCTVAISGLETKVSEGKSSTISKIGATSFAALSISSTPQSRCVLRYEHDPSLGYEPDNLLNTNLTTYATRSEALAEAKRLCNARSCRKTAGNSQSSRSHAFFDVQVYGPNRTPQGCLTFVDLAGKEDYQEQSSSGKGQKKPLSRAQKESKCISDDMTVIKKFLGALSQASRMRGKEGLPTSARLECTCNVCMMQVYRAVNN